jgi:hypothetical protein
MFIVLLAAGEYRIRTPTGKGFYSSTVATNSKGFLTLESNTISELLEY